MSSSAVSFSAPFVGLIIDCCGALVVLIVAAIVGAIGAILSAYAPTLTVVIVGYGVFMGMYNVLLLLLLLCTYDMECDKD